jgi:hypothetical protein
MNELFKDHIDACNQLMKEHKLNFFPVAHGVTSKSLESTALKTYEDRNHPGFNKALKETCQFFEEKLKNHGCIAITITP